MGADHGDCLDSGGHAGYGRLRCSVSYGNEACTENERGSLMTAASESIGRPDNHVIVLFGATGDLARRKLLPGLFHLAAANLLPRHYRIIGSGRSHSALSDADFRRHAREAVEEFGRTKPAGEAWKTFEDALSFGTADQDDASPLIEAVRNAESQLGGDARRLFHLAVPPVAFGSLVSMLG